VKNYGHFALLTANIHECVYNNGYWAQASSSQIFLKTDKNTDRQIKRFSKRQKDKHRQRHIETKVRGKLKIYFRQMKKPMKSGFAEGPDASQFFPILSSVLHTAKVTNYRTTNSK
jgi:hypothetical protein